MTGMRDGDASAAPASGSDRRRAESQPQGPPLPHDDAGRWIGGLFHLGKRYFQERLAEKGLPRVPIPLLLRVLGEPPPSQDDLTRHTTRDKATISRTLRELEDAGLITRGADPDDQRLKRVYPTDRARALEPWLRSCLAEWSEVLTEDFTEDERRTAMVILQRMENNARGRMDRRGCGAPDSLPPHA